MAAHISDEYLEYIKMMRKCDLQDMSRLQVEDIKKAQEAVRKSPIKDGIFKVGTMVIDKTQGRVKRELETLNRMIDELRS